MNILMALSQLEITGAEVYATTIADELIERGNKVYIVSDTLTTPTKAEYIKSVSYTHLTLPTSDLV